MEEIDSLSLFKSVHSRIRAAICDGTLKPNERLNQDQLAEQLNVSRQPVNQALILLRAQGFVTDAGRRGVIVAPISEQVVSDIYQLRALLDRLAAASAAARRWTKEDIEHGLEILEQGDKAVDSCSIQGLIAADMAFHRFLYQKSGNALLAEFHDTHFDHLRRVMRAVLNAGPEYRLYWREHRQIFEAIAQGQTAIAGQVSAKHVLEAAEQVCLTVEVRTENDPKWRKS